MYWIGLTSALMGLVVAISLNGHVDSFIDLPGLVFVLLVGSGITLSAHGFPAVLLTLRSAFIPLAGEQTERAKLAAETSIQSFVAAGWIGVIVGVVQMLSQLDDPSKIGVGAATALLTALYGYIMAYMFCMPLARSLSDT